MQFPSPVSDHVVSRVVERASVKTTDASGGAAVFATANFSDIAAGVGRTGCLVMRLRPDPISGAPHSLGTRTSELDGFIRQP